jgi:D-threonate/D-erythronate kinase
MKSEQSRIIVIADDFTGAAEVAGIGMSHGLDTRLVHGVLPETLTQLTVIDSGIRSLAPKTVPQHLNQLLEKLKLISNYQLFIKIDSVMRGHILLMLKCFLELEQFDRVLLLPGNPAMGRWVEDGVFMIDDVPLHLTEFAHDPEFPVKNPSMLNLLGHNDTNDVRIIDPGEILEPDTICLGNLNSDTDLELHMECLRPNILLAGSGATFETLLGSLDYKSTSPDMEDETAPLGKVLLVQGSRSQVAMQGQWILAGQGVPICKFPAELSVDNISSKGYQHEWGNQVIRELQRSPLVVVSVEGPIVTEAGFPKKLTESMAELVQIVVQKVALDELIIEGGATASAILKRFPNEIYRPIAVPAPGVVRLKAEHAGMNITTKVGSYSWPTGSVVTYLNPETIKS